MNGGRFAVSVGALSGVLLLAVPSMAQRADGPFAGWAGSWSGSGTISVSSGERERIRCRARYAVAADGRAMQQDLRCASDSYKFEVVSNVTVDNGLVSGTWSELTRNAVGNLSGQASGNRVNAQVFGIGFSAGLTLVTTGNSQSVTITPEGTDVRSVNISLRKG